MNKMNVAGALIGLSLVAGAWSSFEGPPSAWLASNLIGMKVVSPQGENLGKIEDIVVHPGGEGSYAVLSFGGWLGMGDKLFAMPWSVLRTVEADKAKKDSERSLVFPLEREQLEAAPGFDKKSWPDTANRDWTKDVDAYYVGKANPNAPKPSVVTARTSKISWRVSELKGTNVQTPGGEKLGDLEELAIDTNGRCSYVAVSVGGFLGIGERVVAVPWDSLEFSLTGEKLDKKVITLASTKEQLEEAPEFKDGKDHCAEMCDPKWTIHVYDYFSCPGYWLTAE